ncbi:MAG: NTP transferase domain-containing protein [Phenylobacterium sp.]|uniref:glycosyltransferase family protein n=1 Tax=Phenylobacterium sp. TaxID=1871053 RepID=UPI0025CD2F64|nr:glycosyltransferase family protein [Phenylobacterium sp.]MBI1199486.1 NTP transferase domain-containing protein [Phenylobacterium sp.]
MNLAILQARMTSTRLPGKVMAPVLGEPMIGRQLERLGRAARLDRIVIATSREASDDPLASYCEGLGLTVFRGELADVLGRFLGALDLFPQAQTVVRLTADCPLADPAVIDATIARHEEAGADYTSNTPAVRTYPHGLDTEVMRRETLEAAGREATDPYEREHVTPFIYRRPERFRIASLSREPSLAHLRWTVDLPEDLDFVRDVYARLYPANPAFTSDDIVALDRNSSGAVT